MSENIIEINYESSYYIIREVYEHQLSKIGAIAGDSKQIKWNIPHILFKDDTIEAMVFKCKHNSEDGSFYISIPINEINNAKEDFDEYLYIINGMFIFKYKLSSYKLVRFNNGRYILSYNVNSIYNIKESRFFIKAQLFGGIDALINKGNFYMDNDTLEKTLAESKKLI